MADTERTTAAAFSRDAIIASEKYKQYADILTIELKPDMVYTADEVDSILAAFLHRPVQEKVNGGRK